ncbi:hypothetical protein HDU88_003766 [Geranomyces variabilis]|nr:hypothetical protein HDU88_003766 [Geranomyces variabilis]
MPTSTTLHLLSTTTAKLAQAHRQRQLSRENRKRQAPTVSSSTTPPPTTPPLSPAPATALPPPPPPQPSPQIALSPLHHSLLLTRLVRALRKAWEAECIDAWSAGDSAVDLRWDDEQSGAEELEDDESGLCEEGDAAEDEDDEKREVLRWIEDIARLAREPATTSATIAAPMLVEKTATAATTTVAISPLALPEETEGCKDASAIHPPVAAAAESSSESSEVEPESIALPQPPPPPPPPPPVLTSTNSNNNSTPRENLLIHSMFDDSLFDLSWEITL